MEWEVMGGERRCNGVKWEVMGGVRCDMVSCEM